MSKPLLVILIALSMTACTAPEFSAPSPVTEAVIEPAALKTSDPCDPDGDGFGGTGCPEL